MKELFARSFYISHVLCDVDLSCQWNTIEFSATFKFFQVWWLGFVIIITIIVIIFFFFFFLIYIIIDHHSLLLTSSLRFASCKLIKIHNLCSTQTVKALDESGKATAGRREARCFRAILFFHVSAAGCGASRQKMRRLVRLSGSAPPRRRRVFFIRLTKMFDVWSWPIGSDQVVVSDNRSLISSLIYLYILFIWRKLKTESALYWTN